MEESNLNESKKAIPGILQVLLILIGGLLLGCGAYLGVKYLNKNKENENDNSSKGQLNSSINEENEDFSSNITNNDVLTFEINSNGFLTETCDFGSKIEYSPTKCVLKINNKVYEIKSGNINPGYAAIISKNDSHYNWFEESNFEIGKYNEYLLIKNFCYCGIPPTLYAMNTTKDENAFEVSCFPDNNGICSGIEYVKDIENYYYEISYKIDYNNGAKKTKLSEEKFNCDNYMINSNSNIDDELKELCENDNTCKERAYFCDNPSGAY